MRTTENLTSNNPSTKAFYDRIATESKEDQGGRINPNGCAICDVDQCQHTDN
jgi:hypothetical protein